MADRFRVLSVMGRQLEGMGISTKAVLRLAGLPSELFQQTRISLTTEEMRALYDAIAEVSRDHAIGLRLGSEERPENYSPISIAALFTRSFRDALTRVARYKRLTSPQEIRISERGKECAVEFVWLLAEVAESPIWIDACFAWTLTIGRRGIGRDIHPSRVELRCHVADQQPYEKFFACPVRFGARHNRLFFRAEDLDQPFITYNPDLLEVIAPQLEAELRQYLANKSLKQQAKGILKRSLAGQRPRLEDVGMELGMSARTLQRKLLEEGTTFHALMAEALHEMAQHYLRQPSLELNEAAYLLGYEDPNSFIRAFHKWEGTSPGDWRATHSQTVQ
ncbi:MAG: AraC family transcriptional regulator [Bryobacteraceae bacterium]